MVMRSKAFHVFHPFRWNGMGVGYVVKQKPPGVFGFGRLYGWEVMVNLQIRSVSAGIINVVFLFL